ncbi:MAG: hypothetical protein J3R72DRAFT_457873 [Linnemannia gamsii]|nr:MAG: hypothetical protein J3R72DRAFT_457873 [Linnemannia gamsii]
MKSSLYYFALKSGGGGKRDEEKRGEESWKHNVPCFVTLIPFDFLVLGVLFSLTSFLPSFLLHCFLFFIHNSIFILTPGLYDSS